MLPPQIELGGWFEDRDLLHIYDIIGKNYGILPSEVSKLSFEDLAINVAALKARGHRIDKLMRQTRRKKTSIFPTVNLHDLINCL